MTFGHPRHPNDVFRPAGTDSAQADVDHEMDRETNPNTRMKSRGLTGRRRGDVRRGSTRGSRADQTNSRPSDDDNDNQDGDLEQQADSETIHNVPSRQMRYFGARPGEARRGSASQSEVRRGNGSHRGARAMPPSSGRTDIDTDVREGSISTKTPDRWQQLGDDRRRASEDATAALQTRSNEDIVDDKMGTGSKNETCHDWWLRKCRLTPEKCSKAHRFFEGRTARSLQMKQVCRFWQEGDKCKWPAWLCSRAHSIEEAESGSSLLRAAEARTEKYSSVPAGRVCKTCGVWFDADDWKMHMRPDSPILCRGL